MTIDHRALEAATVHPRRPGTNAARSVIAVVDGESCDEAGTIEPTSDLIEQLRRMPPCVVVTACESVAFLKRVQERWGRSPSFQFRVTPIEREIFTGKRKRRLTLMVTSVGFFGWRGERCGRNNTVRNRFHMLLDPLTFSGRWLPERTLGAYLQWGTEIRDFCLEQGWNIAPTQGAVARQALRDKRFYPRARRKVPRATNERVRAHLPGNYYELLVPADVEKEHDANYLDQSQCHHYHAIQARLPASDSLYGYGRFRHNGRSARPYKADPQRVTKFLADFAGMIYGTLECDTDDELPSFIRLGEPTYFFTEDLPLFEALSVRVTSIIAAWGSKERDTGLSRYAKWAIGELKQSPAPWKKSLLLSVYGALATSARQHTFAFYRGKGERRELVSKSGVRIRASVHTTRNATEPATNNVLHRALIESSNRTEVLLLARWLRSLGHTSLAIYVDALIVSDDIDIPLPPLPDPWRLDMHLSRLRLISDSQWIAAESARLPGITGAQRRRLLSPGGYRDAARLGSRADMATRAYAKIFFQ